MRIITIDAVLIQIREYIDKAQFELADQYISELLDDKTINPSQNYELQILQAHLLNKKGDFNKSQEKITTLQEEQTNPENTVKFLELSTISIDNLFRLGVLTKALQEINIVKEILASLKETLSDLDYIERYAEIIVIEAGIYWQTGELEKGLALLVDLLEKQKQCAPEEAIADTLHHIGVLYSGKGNHNQALSYLEEAQLIEEKLNNGPRLALLYNNFGWIYRQLGNLQKALDYFEKAKEITLQQNNEYRLAIIINNIGVVYRQEGKYEEATQYLLRSLQIGRKNGNPFEMSTFLFEIIQNYIDLGKRDQVELYLQEFQKICLGEANERIMQRYQVAQALYWKSSSQLRLQFQAQEIFQSIADGPILESENSQCALLNLCELLMKELIMTKNLGILEEINPLLEKLLDLAEKEHSVLLWAETYLLKAKLAILALNIPQARKNLSIAQNYAMEHHLERIALQISNEHDRLLEQQTIWEDTTSSPISFEDRLKLSEINTHISRMMQENTFKMEKPEEETPVLFAIMNENGPMIYSYQFEKKFDYNDQLFGGILSAFHSYCAEIFAQAFDRAKFGKYTIVLVSHSPILFAYIFMGSSYAAQKRLNDTLQDLKNHADLWEKISKAVNNNNVLYSEVLKEFLPILKVHFPEMDENL